MGFQRLLDLYWELQAYPEVPAMLSALKAAGKQTAILSNGSPEMLNGAVRSAGIGNSLDDVLSVVNPDSLVIVDGALVEPSLLSADPESVFQFEREGYFVADRKDFTAETPVVNMTMGLRDTWTQSNG